MSGNKILVVEDDEVSAQVLTDYLESKGYDVCSVANGDDAIDCYQASPPDLMIVDVLLPGTDGFSVGNTVRRLSGGKVPILMMSAVYNDEEAVEFASDDLDAEGFLAKPFEMKELHKEVRRILRSYE